MKGGARYGSNQNWKIHSILQECTRLIKKQRVFFGSGYRKNRRIWQGQPPCDSVTRKSGQEPIKIEYSKQKRPGRGMYRRSVFCSKICIFFKSRAGKFERKTALSREQCRRDRKTGKTVKPKRTWPPWTNYIESRKVYCDSSRKEEVDSKETVKKSL